MKLIKLKTLQKCLLLTFAVGVSFASMPLKSDSFYLAPTTAADLSGGGSIPELARLMLRKEDVGMSFEEYLEKGSIKFPKGNIEILKMNLMTKAIQQYLAIFFLSDQVWLPQAVDQNHFKIVETRIEFPDNGWTQVLFSSEASGFSLVPVSDDIRSKSFELTQFVFQLEALWKAQISNKKAFLGNLVENLSDEQKISFLFLFAYTLNYAEDFPELDKLVYGRKFELLGQVHEMTREVLERHVKGLENLNSRASEHRVDQSLQAFNQILNAVPANLWDVFDTKVGHLLLDLYKAPHALVQRQARAWHARRFDFQKHLGYDPVLTFSNLDSSV